MLNEPAAPILLRNQGEARRVAREHYPFVCCVVCGLEIKTCLTIAHLNHDAGNNDPDNLGYLCWTHHWMFDADFYPIEANQDDAATLARDESDPAPSPDNRSWGQSSPNTKAKRDGQKGMGYPPRLGRRLGVSAT